MEVILYSKECNWYTRCCPLNGGVRYRECPLRETILYMYICCVFLMYLLLESDGEWYGMNKGIDLKDTEKENLKMIKHLHKEIPK